jgi:hypothetical protein
MKLHLFRQDLQDYQDRIFLPFRKKGKNPYLSSREVGTLETGKSMRSIYLVLPRRTMKQFFLRRRRDLVFSLPSTPEAGSAGKEKRLI